MSDAAAPQITAHYFDGLSARAHAVRLHVAAGRLHIDGDQLALAVPLQELQWPERTRHGPRVAHLRGGGSLHCADSAAWDRWVRASGRNDPLVVRAQQSWRGALASVLLIVALLSAGYRWGLPWAARAAVAALPASVDAAIGDTAMTAIDEQLMKPTELPAAQQQQIRSAFARAVARLDAGSVPPWKLEFRSSRIGPNAFALPGGTIVMTDQLVRKVDGDEAVLVGVLGHEMGHLRHRHGMRQLAQVGALGAVAGLLVGDFSALLASVPVWLGQAAYSRDAEREADAEAVRVLKAAGLSPLAMVRFFETMARPGAGKAGKTPNDATDGERRDASWLGIAIASHPADDERMRFFRQAAETR
ncbi:MAG TPA: M48 family metallopeptidase [Albitalea sp.]|nr:M48 family metallopeptidase [Albitalea sp.]